MYYEQELMFLCRLLEACLEFYRQGHVRPIHPITMFEASEVEECFQYMKKGIHIGKIVMRMPEDPADLRAATQATSLELDPNASYLLVGGLGGLGKALATWMVEHGARDLIFLSRSAGSTSEDRSFFLELESQGCSSTAIAGSVSELRDVRRAVSSAARPIKGVIQFAMVLKVC